MVILNTERLELRHFEHRDLEPLYALYRDPEMRRYFPDGTRTLEETMAELEWFQHGHPQHPTLGLWATVERSTGTFLGRCGLLPWQIEGEDEVELAFDMITQGGAKAMELEGYGLKPGDWADLVLVDSETIADAVVSRPPRKLVLKRGRVVVRDAKALVTAP